MKKKLIFILMIIILFAIGNKEVYAAQELTCIYEGGLRQSAVMLVQDNNGFSVYTKAKSKADIDDIWYLLDNNNVTYNFDDTTTYANDHISSCPNYNNYDYSIKGEYTFKFYDEKTWGLDYKIYKSYDYAYNSKIIDDDPQSQEWLMECYYEPVTLYYNKQGMNLENKDNLIYSTKNGFTYEELNAYYEEYLTCPSLYQELYAPSNTGIIYATYYLTAGKGRSKYYYQESIMKSDKDPTPVPPKEGCELLGETTLEYITEINSIIRIVIPILLIVLLIIDLVKAVFSGSEDEVNKIKKKIIKRIIIAVIIFLVPTLINVLLKLVNEIWPEIIGTEICGLE